MSSPKNPPEIYLGTVELLAKRFVNTSQERNPDEVAKIMRQFFKLSFADQVMFLTFVSGRIAHPPKERKS